jgi:predicted RNA-binding Zn-ribbon protein involved in translation (DUF1610 family)
MSERDDYVGACPSCGNNLILSTREAYNDVVVEYFCPSCRKIFDKL